MKNSGETGGQTAYSGIVSHQKQGLTKPCGCLFTEVLVEKSSTDSFSILHNFIIIFWHEFSANWLSQGTYSLLYCHNPGHRFCDELYSHCLIGLPCNEGGFDMNINTENSDLMRYAVYLTT